ncbi:MAG TPA: hypothetical protein VNK04_06555 [Gemmataceae bacterium]|nr:hypothetical protein [Gemmataceae bacterium]
MLVEIGLRLPKEAHLERSYALEGDLLFALADDKRKIYGFDFTPPPFQHKVVGLLSERHEWVEIGNCLRFTLTSPRSAADLLLAVNWIDMMVFIIDSRSVAEIGIPKRIRRWLLFSDPFAWFERNIRQWDIVCFVGTHPYRGIDIKTSVLTFSGLWKLIEPVLVRHQLVVSKSTLGFSKLSSA